MVKDELYTAISKCRICRSRDLRAVIDLGEQSLTGCFPAADAPMPPKAPLVLVRCSDCGLVQLRHSVQTDQMFDSNYGYRSGINSTMRNHLSTIASAAEAFVRLTKSDIVLDIGCNDGTLLNAYETQGIHRLGIDPIADVFREIYPEALKIETSFFSKETFRRISPGNDAKIITSISMFYDIEDPFAFVSDVASVLHASGVWILEQSYLPMMLDQNSFDTICHEHLEYYALKQINSMVKRAGLRIVDVKFNQINGGSFQIWVSRNDAPFPSKLQKIDEILQNEKSLGLEDGSAFELFRERVERIRRELVDLLVGEAGAGKKIYVYGASTKGNVLLQSLALDSKTIVACADRNPIKWGRRTPGSNIPIVCEDDARAKADYFLVLPWHFKEEFISRERNFLDRGGKFIFPLPNPEVVGK